MLSSVGEILLRSGGADPPKSAGWNWTLIVTILLAAASYVVTYLNSVRLETRKARLQYLSDQLQHLYGPLYSLSHTSSQAWTELGKKFRPEGGAIFSQERPLSDVELGRWRLWMREVCMPLNVKMETAIIENAHLIEGGFMPEPFLHLLAHVESYRVVLAQWAISDFTDHTASTPYPQEFDRYVREQFLKLAGEQDRLLSR